MANQLEKVSEGYKQWVGQSVQFSTNQIIAGTTMLLAKSSTAAFGVAVDASGNIFVSDPTQHFIMKVVPKGTVYRYAGLPGTSGNNSGAVVSNYNARFNTPRGLACDAYGNLYVADTGNNQIRKITPDGYTSLVSGSPGAEAGYQNGTNAKFSGPWDICISKSNDIFVADTGNNCVRKVVNGVKTSATFTIAGNGNAAAGDVSGGSGLTARFNAPRAICCAPGGEIYVADAGNYKIKKIWEDGMTRWYSGVGTRGATVGVAATTQFMDIQAMCINNSGVIYLVDFDDGIGARLVRVSQIGGTAVVYSFGQQAGSIAVDNSGKLYLIESPASQGFASSSSSSQSSESSSSESRGNVSTSSSTQSESSSSSESAGNVSTSSSSNSTSSSESSSSESVENVSSSTSSNSSSSTSSSSSL